MCIQMSYGQESKTILTKDGKIHYKTIGVGQPILIINGGPGFSSEGFADIAKELSSFGYTAILYDQRGTGNSTLSTVDSSTITLNLMIQDIEFIRRDFGVAHWIVFGHSFGGMLANYYAAHYPDKVKAMIHSSSGGLDLHLIENAQANLHARLSPQEVDSLSFWRTKNRANGTAYNRRKFSEYLASAYVYDKKHIPVVSQRLMQGDMRLNRLVWNAMFNINFDCKENLKSFNKPVLILQGKQDVIPESLALTAQKVFSNSSVFFLEECGHYGWLDQKEEYLSHIKSFLLQIS
ncbi:alpha/beta fold hydrolase [Gelidibacter sediminis]|nr:alpha/beta hydrolase [Gelidibacter sediminis]